MDITEFADCKYDDLATIRLPWVVQEMNGLFPEDYRSKGRHEEHLSATKIATFSSRLAQLPRVPLMKSKKYPFAVPEQAHRWAKG